MIFRYNIVDKTAMLDGQAVMDVDHENRIESETGITHFYAIRWFSEKNKGVIERINEDTGLSEKDVEITDITPFQFLIDKAQQKIIEDAAADALRKEKNDLMIQKAEEFGAAQESNN